MSRRRNLSPVARAALLALAVLLAGCLVLPEESRERATPTGDDARNDSPLPDADDCPPEPGDPGAEPPVRETSCPSVDEPSPRVSV